MTYEEVFQNALKFCLSVKRMLRSSDAKKWGENRKKRFGSEIWQNVVLGEGLVKIRMDSPCTRIIWKLFNIIG